MKLIIRYFPDKFPSPHTLKTDTRADKLKNFKLAFNVRYYTVGLAL